MKYLLGFFIFLNVLVCSAAIYQQLDSNQQTVYSDTPLSSNATQIEALSIQTVTTDSENKVDLSPKKAIPAVAKPRVQYTRFIIVTPNDQQTIQNQPVIPVQIQVNPELNQGDKIQIYLDNKPSGDAQTKMYFELSNVERGTHQLYAAISDEKNVRILQTNTITIFIHRASVNTINANQNRPSS